jgi:hypothetical protein
MAAKMDSPEAVAELKQQNGARLLSLTSDIAEEVEHYLCARAQRKFPVSSEQAQQLPAPDSILEVFEAFDSQSELLDNPNQLILFDL